MNITIEFQPWRSFRARKNNAEIRRWLHDIGAQGVSAFKGGMGSYPPSSAPGAWPNIRTGSLLGSISFESDEDSVTIGSNMFYSLYLQMGTYKMDKRKMSMEALEEGMKRARLGRWVMWSYT